jgi:hypothetical protein
LLGRSRPEEEEEERGKREEVMRGRQQVFISSLAGDAASMSSPHVGPLRLRPNRFETVAMLMLSSANIDTSLGGPEGVDPGKGKPSDLGPRRALADE